MANTYLNKVFRLFINNAQIHQLFIEIILYSGNSIRSWGRTSCPLV